MTTKKKRPKMTVARISENEVRERLRLLGLLYQRLDGYAAWRERSQRLLDLVDAVMVGRTWLLNP
jgi:hypothetical protein